MNKSKKTISVSVGAEDYKWVKKYADENSMTPDEVIHEILLRWNTSQDFTERFIQLQQGMRRQR